MYVKLWNKKLQLEAPVESLYKSKAISANIIKPNSPLQHLIQNDEIIIINPTSVLKEGKIKENKVIITYSLEEADLTQEIYIIILYV